MNVTMQIEKQVSGVYINDTGHAYGLADLDRIIKQLQAARRWLHADRNRKVQPTQVVK